MSIKIKFNELSYYTVGYIIMIIFFPPKAIEMIPEYSIYNSFLKYSRFIISVLVIGQFCKRYAINANYYLKYVFLMCMWLELSNVINGMGNNKLIAILQFAIPAISLLGIYFIIDNYVRNNRINILLYTGSIYGFLVSILNFLSQLVLEDGFYHDHAESNQAVYVCGNDNSFVFFYLFSAGCVLLYSLYQYKKIKMFALVYSLFLVFSMSLADSTAGFAILLVLNFMVIFSCKEIIHIIRRSGKFFLIVTVILLIWMLWFRGWDSDIVHYLVYEITNEDMNFTSRGILWVGAVKLIINSPLIGYGTFDSKLVSDLFGTMKSAHNTYLQLLLLGGGPALICFLTVIFEMYKQATIKYKTNFFIVVIVSLYLVVFIFEQNPFYLGLYFFISILAITNRYKIF